MKSLCLLILAPLVLCNLAVSGGQGISAEDETDRRTLDNILLQRAESLLLRSVLRKMQDADGRYEGFSSQTERMAKRQHPGKRYSNDLEKRQHPGRRDEDEGEQYLDVERRQHPGKREDDAFVELQRRQHPGRRYLVLHSKRQHPGKRHPEDEDAEGDWDADADEDLVELEKRQHPGKRLWDNTLPDFGINNPCDVLDTKDCSKTSLLLDFLDNINKSHGEEKRQHPGKRFAPEEDLVNEA